MPKNGIHPESTTFSRVLNIALGSKHSRKNLCLCKQFYTKNLIHKIYWTRFNQWHIRSTSICREIFSSSFQKWPKSRSQASARVDLMKFWNWPKLFRNISWVCLFVQRSKITLSVKFQQNLIHKRESAKTAVIHNHIISKLLTERRLVK